MAADAGIFQQYLNPVRSVADYRGDMDKQEQNALTLASTRLANQQAQQDMADTQAVRQAYMQSGGDTNKLRQALLQGGNVKALNAYDKTQLDAKKTQSDIDLSAAHTGKFTADTDAANYDLRIKKSDQAIKDISSFTSPEQALASLQQHVQAGDVSPEHAQMIQQTMPQDKSQFPAWQIGMLQRIMTAKDQMAQISPDANARLSAKTALSGQASTAATAAAGRAQAERHFGATQAAGKVPAGYRANPDGSMSFIPGGPADPNAAGGGKMTEDQGKATGWLVQAENAFGNMKKAMASTPSAAKPGLNDALAAVPSFGLGESVANIMRGTDRQKFMQGTSSLSEALLRAATGAGVNRDEAVQKIRELTPVFGEADGTTQQKMDAIPLYIESLKVRAGPGAGKAAKVLAGKSQGGDIHSQADAILRGK